MSTNIQIGKDINGISCDTIDVSENNYIATLAAGVATAITVPENVNAAFFSFGGSGDVWVSFSGAATVPGSSFTLSKQELNPVSRFVIPGQVISVLCAVINSCQVSFYNNRNS